ncbi:hypothetical protein Sjap_008663 [Stephania japonica]|uniref:Uncharacterized protein n=1 Tax=Stephania japonica TaxID=461633 RepID=A0AAP0PCK1_9MAGN
MQLHGLSLAHLVVVSPTDSSSVADAVARYVRPDHTCNTSVVFSDQQMQSESTPSNVIGKGGDSPVVVAATDKKEGRHQGHPEQAEKKGRVEHHSFPLLFPPSPPSICPAPPVALCPWFETRDRTVPGLKAGIERSLDLSRDQIGPYEPVNGPGQLTLDQSTVQGS